jgi:hypothetical protein
MGQRAVFQIQQNRRRHGFGDGCNFYLEITTTTYAVQYCHSRSRHSNNWCTYTATSNSQLLRVFPQPWLLAVMDDLPPPSYNAEDSLNWNRGSNGGSVCFSSQCWLDFVPQCFLDLRLRCASMRCYPIRRNKTTHRMLEVMEHRAGDRRASQWRLCYCWDKVQPHGYCFHERRHWYFVGSACFLPKTLDADFICSENYILFLPIFGCILRIVWAKKLLRQ